MSDISKVDIFLSGLHVGRIALTSDNLCAFQYTDNWLENGFSISPFELPLKKGVFFAKQKPFDGNFGIFDDSLPDGWGMLILDRYLKTKNINPKSLSILDLLSYTGSNGRGALSFVPDLSSSSNDDIVDIHDTAMWIDNLLSSNEYVGQSIEKLWERGGSPGGARPKIFIKTESGEWMVKFPAHYDSNNIGVTEYRYSILAKKCGIEMPETKILEDRFFAVKRFDRDIDGKRLHTASAAGLLGADYRIPSLDYLQLMQLTRILTGSEAEMWKMFRLMTFNYLIGNRDDHAKNFSFIYRGNQWHLSPAYDLLPSEGFNGYHTTSFNSSINPTDSDLLAVAEKSGINRNKAAKTLKEMKDTVNSWPNP